MLVVVIKILRFTGIWILGVLTALVYIWTRLINTKIKTADKILIIEGIIFSLLGILSVWKDYTYCKAKVVEKVEVLFAEVKDQLKIRNLFPETITHHINQQISFLSDGNTDKITLKSNLLLYTEGKTSKTSDPVPTVEQLMRQV